MANRNLSLIVAFVGLGACPACTDRPAAWTSQLEIGGPYAAGGSVFWTDGTRGLVYGLDADASPPVVGSAALGTNVSFATPSPTKKLLLALTAGREAVKKNQTDEPPALHVIVPQSGGPKVVNRYVLPAAFDRVSITPDDKTAVCWFSANASASSALLRNPNELAVVDLTAPQSATNPSFKTIRSLGSAPLAIQFSPPMTIPPAGARTLAVVVSNSYITFLDIDHPTRPEITVPLASEDSTTSVIPQQIVFAPEISSVFLRATGATDIFAIALDPRTPSGPDDNDYRPRINQPSAGKIANDMLVYKEGNRTLILTANTSQDLSLTDAATSESTAISVGGPVDSIVPMPPDSPTTAVVYSRSSPQSQVLLVDLTDLSTGGARNISTRSLARPVHDLVPVPDSQQILVLHDDTRTVVSILDLGPHRTDTPIDGSVPLESFDFSGSRWLVGVSAGVKRLGLLDLTTYATYDFRLDASPKSVFAAGTHVVVDHGAVEGMVTVLPDATSKREDSHVLWGFFLTGLLDQKLED